MQPIATMTPEFLRVIAATWSVQELHAAEAVLEDLLQERCDAAPPEGDAAADHVELRD